MRPSWIEVPTKDPEESKRFYGKVLGWDFEENPSNQMTYIRDENGRFGHFWPQKGRMAGRPQVSQFIEVKSITPILTKASKNGGTVVQAKTKLPDGMGHVGEFADPIGVVWGLFSSK